jgi:anaerobic ribonucleoside-triphosphate reductase
MRLSRSVWNDKEQLWERASEPYRTLVERKFQEKYRVRSKRQTLVERKLQEMYDPEFQGEGGEEVKSLAEGTIKIMEAQEDNWAGALNIIFGKEDDDASDK